MDRLPDAVDQSPTERERVPVKGEGAENGDQVVDQFYLGVRDEMLVREMESVGRWSSQVCTGCVVEQRSAWGVH